MVKRAFFIFGVALMAVLSFGSCSGPDYSKEIATLDSVRTQLDSAEAELKSIDSAKVGMAVKQIQEDMRTVQIHFHRSKDTVISKETATILTEYRSVLKPFKIYRNRLGKLSADIDHSQSQIDNLIHDLKKGRIDKKDAADYVATEKAEAEKILQTTFLLTSTVKELLPKYEERAPEVRQFVDSLKAADTAPQN